ncbi:hypothetical protein BDW22DRAFT_1352061 [Trametopsis cervina]|nr:hypothetical protein BDW22DRAFT_1352061 [Trametopsis cervina]
MVGVTRRNNSGNAANADDMTDNPSGDMLHDDSTFNPDGDFVSAQPVGARGADNQPTGQNWVKEDQETNQSESTGRIPRCTFGRSYLVRACR